jgi:hypothetical protein
MQYLVIYKKPGSVLGGLSSDRLTELMGMVEKVKEQGSMNGVYGMVGGGMVAIVTAPDQAALARGLRKCGIHGAEIHPLCDAVDLIRNHLESRSPVVQI